MASTPILIILIILFCALLAAAGQIFYKLSSPTFTFNPLSWFTNKWLLLAASLYLIVGALFIWSLKHGNVSVIFPVMATSYIWTAIFARIFLNEPFPAIKWLGIAFIILGVFLIAK